MSMRILWRSETRMPLRTLIRLKTICQRFPDHLLDRIDLHVDVPAVEYSDLTSTSTGESSVEN